MAKGKDGWYVLQRSILDSPIWTSEEAFGKRSAYIDLLLMANYEDKKVIPRHSNDVLTIHKGETLTSFEHLANRWKWSKKKTIGYIDQLEKAGLLKRKTYNFGTVLTLVEYSESGNRRTANDTANDTAKDTSVVTANDTAKGTRHKEIKESKRNDKEKKEINKDAKRPGVFSWEGEPE